MSNPLSRALGLTTATQKELLDLVKDSGLPETDQKVWRARITAANKEKCAEILQEFQTIAEKSAEPAVGVTQSSSSSSKPSADPVPSTVGKTVASTLLPPGTSSSKNESTDLATKASNALIIQNLGFQVAPDGSVMKKVDLVEFQSQVTKVVTKINKDDVQKKLLALSASQDTWSVIIAFLQLSESVSLIALCSVSLVMSPADRDVINIHLSTISVLQGRTGKLQKALVNLAGFIGLACAKDNTSVQRLTRFVPNPLLGEPARELQPRKMDPKLTKEENEVASKRQKEQYDQYVQIHKEITLTHSFHFKELSDKIKTRVRAEMDSWFITG